MKTGTQLPLRSFPWLFLSTAGGPFLQQCFRWSLKCFRYGQGDDGGGGGDTVRAMLLNGGGKVRPQAVLGRVWHAKFGGSPS